MKNWLISNADLQLITNDYEWDWVLAKFIDNGITSPEDAYWKLRTSRFEYTNPDCPFCEVIDKHYELNSECWKCKSCLKKFTITSGTYIENSKLDYYHWWRFAYLMGELKITNGGVIANDLELTHKTVWGMIETVRVSRKQTSDKKFVNGNEVLVFKNIYEVIDLLIKRKPKSVVIKKLNCA